MMIAVWAVSGALAAPSTDLCEEWRTSLLAQSRGLAALDHRFENDNVRVASARVDFPEITASVRDGVCRVRAVGDVDLQGQVQVAMYGMQSACPVRLAKAPVVTNLDISGTRRAPKVVRSSVDLDGLKSRMSLCFDVDMIKGLVVDIANDWVGKQLPQWHGAIEQSLARP